MEQAIESSEDDSLRADIYADLALESAIRGGMFPVHPDRGRIEGWLEQTLGLAEPESPAVAKALLGRAHWVRMQSGSSGRADADAGRELAERVGDGDLKVLGRVELALVAIAESRYEEAQDWVDRAYELYDQVTDPDYGADVHALAAACAALQGRVEDARRLAAKHESVLVKLTPHHRIHGIAITSEVEELALNWPAILELEGVARARVAANLETPCMRNCRTLLLCAVAAAHAGDAARADALEELAEEVRLEGYEGSMSAPEIRLALARGELGIVEERVATQGDTVASTWFTLAATSTRLDALVALGDRAAVEREAPPLLESAPLYLPFALRALGTVREDDALLRQAVERFDSMGLDVPAEETRRLLSGGA